MPRPDLAALKTLLAEERQSLRRGDLGALGPLAGRKEALVRGLDAGDGPALRTLRAMLEENQRLIAAAMKGVQAARMRLRGIVEAGAGTSVYTAQGRLVTHAAAAEGVERRA